MAISERRMIERQALTSQPKFPFGDEPDADAELARRIAEGDQDAFATLFERHKDVVYTVAARMVRRGSWAEDICQDTFLRLWQNAGSVATKTSVRGWLLRVASNLAIDRWRKERTRHGGPDDGPVAHDRQATGVPPVETAAGNERDRAVRDVVAGLPPNHRLIIVLRYGVGLSYAEIKDVLKCSMGTVKSRLARAHKALHEPLTEVRASHGTV